MLDTYSCILQGVIPYGAQMLVAVSTAVSLGSAVYAFEILPSLVYPYALLVSSLVYIIFNAGKKAK